MSDKEIADNELVFEFDSTDSAKVEAPKKTAAVELPDDSEDNPLSHMLDDDESIVEDSLDEDLFAADKEEKDSSPISFDLDEGEEESEPITPTQSSSTAAKFSMDEEAEETPIEDASEEEFEDFLDNEQEESFEEILKAREQENPQGLFDVQSEFASKSKAKASTNKVEENVEVEEEDACEIEQSKEAKPAKEEKAEPLVTKEAAPKKKSNKKEKIIVYSLSAVAALLVVGLAMTFILGDKGPKTDVTISQSTINSLVKQHSKILKTSQKKQAAAPVDTSRFFWRQDFEVDGIKGSLDIASNKTDIVAFTLNFSAPPPAKLTPSQVASGTKQPAWMDRLEMTEIKEILKQPESTFSGEEKLSEFLVSHDAKAYIKDHGDNAYRRVATATINGKFDPKTNTIKGRWTVIDGLGENGLPDKNSVKRVDDEKFQLLFTSQFEVQKQEESPKTAEKDETETKGKKDKS